MAPTTRADDVQDSAQIKAAPESAPDRSSIRTETSSLVAIRFSGYTRDSCCTRMLDRNDLEFMEESSEVIGRQTVLLSDRGSQNHGRSGAAPRTPTPAHRSR